MNRKSEIMKRAWAIRRIAAEKFGCKVKEILFNDCLKMAWRGEIVMERLAELIKQKTPALYLGDKLARMILGYLELEPHIAYGGGYFARPVKFRGDKLLTDGFPLGKTEQEAIEYLESLPNYTADQAKNLANYSDSPTEETEETPAWL